jgi:hypothetical protein
VSERAVLVTPEAGVATPVAPQTPDAAPEAAPAKTKGHAGKKEAHGAEKEGNPRGQQNRYDPRIDEAAGRGHTQGDHGSDQMAEAFGTRLCQRSAGQEDGPDQSYQPGVKVGIERTRSTPFSSSTISELNKAAARQLFCAKSLVAAGSSARAPARIPLRPSLPSWQA